MMDFTGKSILITGGSGYLGSHICKYFQEKQLSFKKIVVFSRDWLKQEKLRKELGGDDRFRFFIGDVRDLERLKLALKGIDIVIHAAAIKDLTSCEFNPDEAVATNVAGTQNVIHAAIYNKCERNILISTDKAVSPANIYGATKLTAEKLWIHSNYYSATDDIQFRVCRYGNVFGSSGSVYHVWKAAMQNKEKVKITNMAMTRYFINAESAVKFILDEIKDPVYRAVSFKSLKSFKLKELAIAMSVTLDVGLQFEVTGIRDGEKLHETLIEGGCDSSQNEFLDIPDLFDEINKLEGC